MLRWLITAMRRLLIAQFRLLQRPDPGTIKKPSFLGTVRGGEGGWDVTAAGRLFDRSFVLLRGPREIPRNQRAQRGQRVHRA